MKKKLIGSLLLSFACWDASALAAVNNDPALMEYLKKIEAHTAKLESEVSYLRQQVRQLKQKKLVHQPTMKVKKGHHQQDMIATQSLSRSPAPKNTDHAASTHMVNMLNFLDGAPVVTSPYVGIRSEFDGSDLIVNLSTINEDVRFIQHRQKVDRMLKENHAEKSHHHIVDLSGRVEALAVFDSPYAGSSTKDINLANAELDTLFHVNDWIMGFMGIKYDRSSPTVTAQRAANSRLFLDEGFVTIGNFDRSPFYATAGQFYVPFGRHSTFLLSASPTIILGENRARALNIGFEPHDEKGFYGSIYGFVGDVTANHGNQGGINFGYKTTVGQVSFDIGGGIISNLADSDGMQVTGLSTFPGFGGSIAAEQLNHQVYGYDVHAGLTIAPLSFLVEFLGAGDRFSANDLTFNGHPAKPNAAEFEVAYHFNFGEHPANLVVGFGHTAEALGVNLPEQVYSLAFNTAIWEHTIFTVEYRHAKNYRLSDVATGRVDASVPGAVCAAGSCISAPIRPMGKTDDMLSLHFGVYF